MQTPTWPRKKALKYFSGRKKEASNLRDFKIGASKSYNSSKPKYTSKTRATQGETSSGFVLDESKFECDWAIRDESVEELILVQMQPIDPTKTTKVGALLPKDT